MKQGNGIYFSTNNDNDEHSGKLNTNTAITNNDLDLCHKQNFVNKIIYK